MQIHTVQFKNAKRLNDGCVTSIMQPREQARSGNALPILLAALWRTANPDDQDTVSLIDSAIVTHSQLTKDIGASVLAAMMSWRQI